MPSGSACAINCDRYPHDCYPEEGFFPDVVAETSDVMLSMHLAREGQAVAVVPDFVARQHDPTGVRVVPFASTAFGWKMSLIHCLGPPLAGTCQKLAQHLSGNRSRMGS